MAGNLFSLVVKIVVERLGDWLIDESKSIYGVSDQVQELHAELMEMRAFLKDADAKQGEDERILLLVAEVRKLADDTDDVIERFKLGVESRRRRGMKYILKRYFCITNKFVVLHKVGKEIQKIKSRISHIRNHREMHGMISLYEGSSNCDYGRERRTYPDIFGEELVDFVGFEGDVEELVEHLVDDRGFGNYSLVSICGMGGLGKTAIARKVYNHAKVKHHFGARTWVCISSEWETRDILERILNDFIPEDYDRIANNSADNSELFMKLNEIQQQKRCLVVLDDIWSTNAWDCIKDAFPKENTASKIILTSRNRGVAMHLNPAGFIHEPRFLNKEESWMLLKKKALITERFHNLDPKEVKEMEKLGIEMISHCGGLPLAIVELGGILYSKHRLVEWENSHRNIKSLLGRGESRGKERRAMSMILELSYKDLPYILRPCFLYLGKFKEDSEIEAERLYQLWIAENMVSSREGQTMMDAAESYLDALAARSMVQVQLEEEGYQFKKFKSCRLHNIMRDLCLYKAKQESFFAIIDFKDGIVSSSSSFINNSRRLVIYSQDEAETSSRDVSLDKEPSQRIRSLLFFNEKDEYKGSLPSMVKSQLKDFILLRVLVLEGLGKLDPAVLGSIANLINLRYLSLRRTCFLMSLPSIENLLNLQTLDLRDGPYPKGSMLGKMRQLRYVYLPVADKETFSAPKLRLDGAVNLEILENFDSAWCQIKDLIKLTNLRKLIAQVAFQDIKATKEIIPYLKSNKFKHMKHLSLRLYDRDFRREEWKTNILNQLAGSDCAPELTLDCRLGKKLQVFSNRTPTLPSRLTKLTLISSKLVEDPMPVLEALPNLRFLHLQNAFKGRKMVCLRNGFPQLRTLELKCLRNFQNLAVLDGAMPVLSRIGFYECDELRTIPDGLRFIRTLKELEIFEMPKEFTDSVQAVLNGEGGVDFEKIGHVASMIIDKLDYEAPRDLTKLLN